MNQLTRRAILVGAPGKPNVNFLPGVKRDIDNYKRFLMSPIGGAWRQDEIVPVIDPSKSDLLKLLQVDVDFTLLIFSGHGEMDRKSKETIIHINNNEKISYKYLKSKSPKQLMILDACRNWIDDGLSGFINEGLLSFPSHLNSLEARQLYDSQIQKAEVGIEVIFSCSEGQSSYDSIIGGHYSLSLLQASKSWVDTSSGKGVLSILEAYRMSMTFLKKSFNEEQIPRLLYTKVNGQGRTQWFPFVVRKQVGLLNSALY